MISTKDVITMLKRGSDKIRVVTNYQENTKRSEMIGKKIVQLHETKSHSYYAKLPSLISFLHKEYYKAFRYIPFFTDSRQYELIIQIERNHPYYRITNNVVQVYTINWDTDEGVEEYIFNSTVGMSKDDFFNLSLSTDVCDVVLDEHVVQIREVLKSKKRTARYVYSYTEHRSKYKPRLKRKRA